MLTTQRLRNLAGQGIFSARQLSSAALSTDMHMHTTYTDGRSTIAEMLAAATGAGMATVAFTEHVRRNITWFEGFKEEVRRIARQEPRLTVLVGIEAKALDLHGALDADEKLIAQAQLVLGAFHSFPAGVEVEALTSQDAAVLEYQALKGLLEHPEVDVLAHPGAFTKKRFGHFPFVLMRALVRQARERGRAIELNAEYNSPAELNALLQLCIREDAWVSLGSNAHHQDEVGLVGARMKEIMTHVG
jgi:histidinol phosphatase-like PHP family hydrolase